ncbi:MAG: ABC transporter ATP-binding protein [Candidatus Aminicenantes bacterium]|nr:ABC transporter ATP-binding protein [Candidatus Aminicenantes bacterium]
MTTNILELHEVKHRFSDSEWTLSVSRFSLGSGIITAVIGPNGSGKSTLMRIATGILIPLSGSVLLEGQPLTRLNRRSLACRLGYLPQEIQSQYDITVEDVAAMGRYPHLHRLGTLTGQDWNIVDECLKTTEMSDKRKRRLSQLSGGEKKRAFLASVLAQKPRVLILDEPAAALDIHHQIRFFNILRDLARSGIAVAVVTHNMNFASLFGDTILFLSEGRPIAMGPPEEVLAKKRLQSVYGPEILVRKHPESGRPIVLPSVPKTGKA